MASPSRFCNRVFRSASFATPAFLLGLALGAPHAESAPLSYGLGFASLPSAQGWSYQANGADATVVEGTVFAVDGTMLSQNTIGRALGTAGAGLYYQIAGGITTTALGVILLATGAAQFGRAAMASDRLAMAPPGAMWDGYFKAIERDQQTARTSGAVLLSIGLGSMIVGTTVTVVAYRGNARPAAATKPARF